MFGAKKGNPEEQVMECSDYKKDKNDPDNLYTCVGLNSRKPTCAACCAHCKVAAHPIQVATTVLCTILTTTVVCPICWLCIAFHWWCPSQEHRWHQPWQSGWHLCLHWDGSRFVINCFFFAVGKFFVLISVLWLPCVCVPWQIWG